MKFPVGFDPLAVERVLVSSSHFATPEDLDEAIGRLAEVFPNAGITSTPFVEDRSACVLHFEPQQGLSSDEMIDSFSNLDAWVHRTG